MKTLLNSKLNLFFNLSFFQKLFVFTLFLFLISRVITVFHNLPAWQFCDELVVSGHLWRLVVDKTIIFDDFRSGGLNILPLLPIGFFLTETKILVIGKFLYLVVLGLGTVFFIYKISLLIIFNKNIAILSSIIFMLSPYVFAVGEYWYPDHYIYFFSSGFLYFLIKLYREINQQNKTNFILLGIFSSMLVSVKWTGFILMPVLFLFLLFLFINQSESRLVFFKNCLYLLCSFLVIFFLFNYSIFFNFDKFIYDFTWNISHYASYEKNNFEIFYYLSVIYFLFASFLSIIFILFGYVKIFKLNKLIFTLFTFTVLFYSCFLGLKGGLVLHRNVSILIPFIFPIIGIGIYQFYILFTNKFSPFVRFLSNSYIFFFSLVLISNFIFLFFNNLHYDSRFMAMKWLQSNLLSDVTIGTNEACSGPSPAHGFTFQDNNDPMFVYNYEYYVINSYWDSKIDYLYHYSKPIITLMNQHYVHFNYWNEKNIFKNSLVKDNSFENYNSVMSNYELIKTFKGYGPVIYVLKKK